MTIPSEGVKDLLVAAGAGVFNATSGWSIRISRQQDSPDTHITVYDTTGEDPNPRYLLDFPRTQVKVRGNQSGYVAARDKCTEVVDALQGLPSQTIGGDLWVGLWAVGGPIFLGYDDKDRPEFTLNFRHIIEPPSGTYRESL
jgi:hypothetical protein